MHLVKSLQEFSRDHPFESASEDKKRHSITLHLEVSEALSFYSQMQGYAKYYSDQALEKAKEFGDSQSIAVALRGCGNLAILAGNYEVAEQHIR